MVFYILTPQNSIFLSERKIYLLIGYWSPIYICCNLSIKVKTPSSLQGYYSLKRIEIVVKCFFKSHSNYSRLLVFKPCGKWFNIGFLFLLDWKVRCSFFPFFFDFSQIFLLLIVVILLKLL